MRQYLFKLIFGKLFTQLSMTISGYDNCHVNAVSHDFPQCTGSIVYQSDTFDRVFRSDDMHLRVKILNDIN
jgi:hypothetical protein